MMNRIGYIAWLLTFLLLAGCASSGTTPGTDSDEAEPDESAPISAADTYDEDTVLFEAGNFFGEGAKGLADVLNRTFSEQGRPNGYITGPESCVGDRLNTALSRPATPRPCSPPARHTGRHTRATPYMTTPRGS